MDAATRPRRSHAWNWNVSAYNQGMMGYTSGKQKFELRDGNPVLVKLPKLDFFFALLVHHWKRVFPFEK